MKRPGAHRKRNGRPVGPVKIGPVRGPCPSDKVCHETRADANLAVSRQARGGKLRRVYRCPECRYWHLTAQRESEAPPLVVRPVRPGPSVPPS